MAYITLLKKKGFSFYHLIKVFNYRSIENSLWLNMDESLKQFGGPGCPCEHQYSHRALSMKKSVSLLSFLQH